MRLFEPFMSTVFFNALDVKMYSVRGQEKEEAFLLELDATRCVWHACMYVCVCVCMCVNGCVCACVHGCVCMCACVHGCVHVHACVCMDVCVCVFHPY